VLHRIFAGGPAAGAGHTDTETHNSWKPSVLRPILPESVQPAHSLWHASTVTHDRLSYFDL